MSVTVILKHLVVALLHVKEKATNTFYETIVTTKIDSFLPVGSPN